MIAAQLKDPQRESAQSVEHRGLFLADAQEVVVIADGEMVSGM